MPLPPLPARVVLAWVAIFPLVVVARFLFAPLEGRWPGVLQTAILMALVVPVAVVWTVSFQTRVDVWLRWNLAAGRSR